MSADTKAALDRAIEAHAHDELDEAVVTGYVLQITAMNSGDFDLGQTRYLRVVPEGQNAHTTLGIIEYAHVMYRVSITRDEY